VTATATAAAAALRESQIYRQRE